MALCQKHNWMNKKGATLSGWTEVAAFSILTLLLIGIIYANMNLIYGSNIDATFGLNPNSSLAGLKEYQSTLQSNIDTGKADTEAITGLSVTTVWEMIKAGLGMTVSFLTGGWIEKISTDLIGFAPEVALIFRILFLISLGYIVIKLLLKVKI